MKKYKLLKEYPPYKVGDILTEETHECNPLYSCKGHDTKRLGIGLYAYPDYFEEIKEREIEITEVCYNSTKETVSISYSGIEFSDFHRTSFLQNKDKLIKTLNEILNETTD